MKKAFYALLAAALLLSCKKDEPLHIPAPPGTCTGCGGDTSRLQVIWQAPLREDSAYLGSIQPLLVGGNVLFSQRTYDWSSTPEKLVLLDADNGHHVWTWGQENEGESDSSGDRLDIDYRDGKILYLSSWHDVYAIDAATGQTAWASKLNDPDCGWPRFLVHGGHVYHNRSNCSVAPARNYLVRAPVHTGQWDTVYQWNMTEGYDVGIEMPGFWAAPNGDTVLVIQNRALHTTSLDSRLDVRAYNLNSGEVTWTIRDLDPIGYSNVHPPVVWQGLAFLAGARAMYCIDVATGDLLWKKEFVSSSLFSNFLVAGGELLVKLDGHTLSALDPLTGQEKWFVGNCGENCSDMTYFDGMVYYTSRGEGKLYAVDTRKHQLVWAEDPPNQQIDSDAEFYDGVTVDTVNRRLYTSDRFFAMCLKLPQR